MKKEITRFYHPSPTFVESMAGLIALFHEWGIDFPLASISDMEKALKSQEKENLELASLERAADKAGHEFSSKQAQRFALFMKALEQARSAYRDDSMALKALERFARKFEKSAPASLPPASEPSNPEQKEVA